MNLRVARSYLFAVLARLVTRRSGGSNAKPRRGSGNRVGRIHPHMAIMAWTFRSMHAGSCHALVWMNLTIDEHPGQATSPMGTDRRRAITRLQVLAAG
jgi:hypothetical protein